MIKTEIKISKCECCGYSSSDDDSVFRRRNQSCGVRRNHETTKQLGGRNETETTFETIGFGFSGSGSCCFVYDADVRGMLEIPKTVLTASAATFDDINADEVFLQQGIGWIQSA